MCLKLKGPRPIENRPGASLAHRSVTPQVPKASKQMGNTNKRTPLAMRLLYGARGVRPRRSLSQKANRDTFLPSRTSSRISKNRPRFWFRPGQTASRRSRRRKLVTYSAGISVLWVGGSCGSRNSIRSGSSDRMAVRYGVKVGARVLAFLPIWSSEVMP